MIGTTPISDCRASASLAVGCRAGRRGARPQYAKQMTGTELLASLDKLFWMCHPERREGSHRLALRILEPKRAANFE